LECDISAFIVSGDAITYDGKYIIETTVGLQVKNLKFLSDGNIKIISENPAYRTLSTYEKR